MKKGVLFLVCAMIFTMILPAQAFESQQAQIPKFHIEDGNNGRYVVSVKLGDEWNVVGSLIFGKHQSKQTIDIGSYLNSDNLIIKLSQDGGGAAYLDSVLLDGTSAIKANSGEEKVLQKLSKEDLDITPVGTKGIVLEFANINDESELTVVGRIENKVISKEPLQFPEVNNFKSKNEVKDFYTYTIGSNIRTVHVDGMLDEVQDMEPFVKEYRVPDSGHPAGDTYFWVMNDDENLYISMDVTPDNTFDGDKDYAKVYVKTDTGIEEYKVSVPETTWGNTGFTYTDKVGYEHKVYEFSIPINETNASRVDKLSLAFVVYGTVSLDYNCNSPALAYDSNNEVYLSVFEHLYTYDNVPYQRIVGEFVDKSGMPIDYKFIIANTKINNLEIEGLLSDPHVAFNSESNEFLVTWVENNESIDYVCAKKINYNYTHYEPFIVSSDDESYHEIETPKVSYDSDENVFLVVWQEANVTNEDSIYGQFIDEDSAKIDARFNISTTSNVDKNSPSLFYSESQEGFLVAWQDGDNIASCGVKLLENNNKYVSNMTIVGEGENPNVSYNGSSQRLFVTWENVGNLYSQYFDLKSTLGTNYLDPYSVSDKLTISTPHDGYMVGYPSAYYDGYHNMLSVWSMFKPEQECFAELCYVDIYAEPEGPNFFIDEESENRNAIDDYKVQIVISGDNDIQNLIAYVEKETDNIGYRIIGDTPEVPSIKSYENPDIAYDSYKGLYLSVFEYRQSDYDYYPLSSQIYGEIINQDGYVVSDKFPISKDTEINFNYAPTVAYDRENKNFLVVWSSRYNDNYILMATTVSLDESNEDIETGDAFPISGNDINNFNGYEEHPDLAYDNNEKFLLVWTQRTNKDTIHGRIVDSNNYLDNDNFFLVNDSYNQSQPSVCYNPANDSYLVAWNYYGDSGVHIKAQVVNSSGELPGNSNIIIGGNWCNFPNVSFNTRNGQFFITWHDYSDSSVIKGHYINLNSELVPEKIQNELKITPEDYYNGIYPASYGDGNGKLLCAWSSTLFEDNIYNLRLQYIDQNGSHIGEAFYSDDYDENYTRNDLTASSLISMSGNNQGKVIIAYYYEPEELYRGLDYNPYDYKLNINYLVFGENYIEPYIEFSNSPFDEIIVGDRIQTNVNLYNNEFPTGKEIDEDLYYFSLNPEIAAIDRTGLITAISEGETNVCAVYDPWAESDGDDVKFSDESITMKNPEKVKVMPKQLPSLEFDKEVYSVQLNKDITFSVTLNNYNNIKSQDVTGIVTYKLGNPEIASISTSGAITGLTAGTTTVSAIYADNDVEPALATIIVTPVSSGSSSTPRTPIGQILVDNKVLETLFKEDVKVKNNTYTFTADKSGESARLWLNSGFYKNLAADYPNRIIKFNWDNGTYTLPLNCHEVLNEIITSTNKVNIYIEKVDDKDIIKAANASAERIGADIISELIDFSVIVERDNGNKEINSLDFYGEKTINKLSNIDERISTAMKLIENKETLTFAPSVFDGNYSTIKYRGNGIFTVIENPQTFNDITNHWAKNNIEKLATRNIAFGKENNNFKPNDFITRAEFAVMITRALGITEEEGSNDFTDVSNEWFAEDISTAYEKELINGKSNDKFYPNEKIQRKDMAVIIQNALDFTGINLEVSNTESVLSTFIDSSSISNYAREGIAICAKSGIIMGRDTKNFDPDENATRAEASAIVERMLRYLEFMN